LAIGGLVAAFTALSVYEEKQKNQGKEIAERLTEQKTKADELVTAYERLNPQKAIDQTTTEKLIRLYPELAGKIEANVTSVDELRRALRELDEEKPLKEAAPFIEKAKKAYDDYLRAIAAYESPLATSEGEDSLRVYRKHMEKMLGIYEEARDKANVILDTIGKEINPESGFEVVESTKAQYERLIREGEAAADAAAKEAEKQARKISQRLSEIPLTSEQQLNDSINQIKSYLNQRADLERTEGEARIKSYQDELERIKNNEFISNEERIAAVKAVSEATEEVRKQMAAQKEADEKKELEKELSEFKETLQERVKALVEAGKTEAEIKEELLTVSAKNRIAAEKALNDELKNLQAEQTDYIAATLKTMGETEAQALLERKNAFTAFLTERLNAQVLFNEEEKLSDEERVKFLEEQRNLLLENFKENEDAKLAIQKAYDNALLAEEQRVKEKERKLLEERLGAFSTLFGGLSSLLEIAGEENRGAAIAARALASAEAAINSYLAFTKALASSVPPFNYILAAGVLASGIAQQVKIINTPIPSAETGGRFIVPNSVGSDRALMKVNQGEEVNITPRGMTGFNETQNIIVQLDKQTLFNVVNEGIRSNDIMIAAVNY
jgi:hypothetical protein